MVVSNGQTKVAQYGQWDHYPSGQGLTVLEFLRDIIAKGELEKFKERIDSMRWGTEEELQSVREDSNWETNTPWVSRDYGAGILQMIHDGTYYVNNFPSEKVKKSTHVEWLTNHEDFLKDSLFCEGCFVVDLDSRVFEYHEGFNKTPVTEGRFKDVGPIKEQDGSVEYHPVRLVATFSLDDLPNDDDFVKACTGGEEEGE